MTRTELNQFQTMLKAKGAELARALQRRDGIAIDRTPDELEEIQFAADRDLSTRSLERGSNVLRSVRAALDRIADGSYGTCEECEEEISHKRLQAVPWATLCIGCQEQTDHEHQAGVGYKERVLRKAA